MRVALMDRLYMGIDPGVNGGVTVVDENGEKFLVRACPDTIEDVVEIMRALEGYRISAVIEKVHSMPGQGVVSVFTFGKNFGMWLGILSAKEIRYVEVTPQKWQKWFGGMPKKAKFEDVGRFKTKHKRYLKELAQQRMPGQKITLKTADSVLLAFYCKNEAWPNG